MSSWGILGKPSREQINHWMDLPHGQFKNLVADIKKKGKGKALRRYTVEVRENQYTYKTSFVSVDAFDHEHATNEAKMVNKADLDWSKEKTTQGSYSYIVSQSQINV